MFLMSLILSFAQFRLLNQVIISINCRWGCSNIRYLYNYWQTYVYFQYLTGWGNKDKIRVFRPNGLH
jgi:hypothetical protein